MKKLYILALCLFLSVGACSYKPPNSQTTVGQNTSTMAWDLFGVTYAPADGSMCQYMGKMVPCTHVPPHLLQKDKAATAD